MGLYKWVQKTGRWHAQTWGKMFQRKIRELSRDVVVTGLDWQTDNEDSCIWSSYY